MKKYSIRHSESLHPRASGNTTSLDQRDQQARTAFRGFDTRTLWFWEYNLEAFSLGLLQDTPSKR